MCMRERVCTEPNILVNGIMLEVVNAFVYLISDADKRRLS